MIAEYLFTAWHIHFSALAGALGWFKNVFFFFLISKTKKEEKLENKSKKVKQKKKIQKSHSGEEESSDENTSDIKQPKQTREKHQNDSHISSEEEVDISRGEGDMQSSSDEEDEGNLRFEIAQVWTLLLYPLLLQFKCLLIYMKVLLTSKALEKHSMSMMQSWEFARVKVFPLFQLSKVVKIWTALMSCSPCLQLHA